MCYYGQRHGTHAVSKCTHTSYICLDQPHTTTDTGKINHGTVAIIIYSDRLNHLILTRSHSKITRPFVIALLISEMVYKILAVKNTAGYLGSCTFVIV